MKIKVFSRDLKPEIIEVENKITVEEILKKYQDKLPYPIYSCKFNNMYRGLNHVLTHDGTLEFLDIRNQACWQVLQNSLVFMYIKAVHDILGENIKLSINNSLNKGLYTHISYPIDETIVLKIENRMKELVNKKVPINKVYLSKEEGMKYCEKHKIKDTLNLIKYTSEYGKSLLLYELDNEYDIFYGLMVPNTSYLKLFELKYYKNNVLLRFPHPSNPLIIQEYKDQTLLYDAYKEARNWSKVTGIKYITDLNKIVGTSEIENLYLIQEALHEKKIASIADEIQKSNKHIVLICGPSSSGKTSFAKRLSIQLNVLGLKTLYMSTDDFFVEANEKPRDENGELDLESIKAVDTNLFIKDLNDLLDKKEVNLPTFDFIKNTKVYGNRITSIDDNYVIVIEGIHALNPLLTNGVDDNEKYKIYISPLTPIGINAHNRISATDARMLRRIVRDSQFRNREVEQVLQEWKKVRIGEEKNIFPYHDQANVFFNSNCIYELPILKKYAEPLLLKVKRDNEYYAEAQRMLSFLQFVKTIDDDSAIVNNSIMREFIGGSILVK